MKYKIEFLNKHPDKIREIAEYFFKEWGHLIPNKNVEDVEKSLGHRINEDKIPLTLIAKDENENFIGTISLKEFDMETHRDFTPWLASLYVKKDFRNCGIGKTLIHELINVAKKLKISKLYLYTENAKEYYSKLGWKILETEIYHESTISIMEYKLDCS